MATKAQHIKAVLDRPRAHLGLGEHGPNSNFIVDWYNLHVAHIGNGPWCEMTNTWAMWTGGAKKLKKGRAFTPWGAGDGAHHVNGSSWHLDTKGMQAGDEVYYNWSGKKGSPSYAEHTGTVEKINGDGTFYVLEGNTGDKLLRRHRDKKFVIGYVRFAWNRLSGDPTPSVPKPPTTPKPGDLKVDGVLGGQTIRLWQHIMKTPVDGKISNPSTLVRAVQTRLKATVDHNLVVDGKGIVQDGHRYRTVGALQRYLKSPVDEVISKPTSQVVRAIQRKLNSGSF